MIITPNFTWITRGLYGLAMVSLLFAAQACSDDNDDNAEPQDTTPPQIAFSNLTDGQTVRNTVKATLTAVDEKGIEKIEIYVDGTILATITAEPFEFSWDSNSAADGPHAIKAVVKDKNGNAAEKIVSVTVQNVLVTITVPVDQLDGGSNADRGFVFLSNTDGKLLVATEYQNGQKLELKAAGFEGEEFFLTEVFVQNKIEVGMYTFAQVERGKTWSLIDDSTNEPGNPNGGEAKFTFTNADVNSQYLIISNASANNIYPGDTETSVTFRKSPAKAYITRSALDGDVPLKYNIFSNIAVGSTTPINLASINKDLVEVKATVPADAQEFSASLRAFSSATDFSEYYRISENHWSSEYSTGSTISVHHPGTAFPAYYTETGYTTGPDYTVYRGIRDAAINTENINYNVSFAFANNKLTYSTASNFDMLLIEWDEANTDWLYILPPGQNKVLPALEIPALLKDWSFPGLDYPNGYEAIDFKILSGYSGLKDYIRTAAGNSVETLFDNYLEYIQVAAHFDTPNGRTKASGRRHNIHAGK